MNGSGEGMKKHPLSPSAPLLLIIFFLIFPLISPYAASEWSEWRGSADHSGVGNEVGPSSVQLIWRYQTSDQVQSSPVFYSGRMYIGSDDGNIYCLDPEIGELLWKYKTGGAVEATPLIHSGRLFVGSADGNLYCLTLPGEGERAAALSWNFSTGSSILSSAHLYRSSVIFGCHDGYLYRVSTGGRLIWRVRVGDEIWATPLIDTEGGRAFIGDIGGRFVSVDLETGRILWERDLTEIYSSGTLSEGYIYIPGGESEFLYCLNAENGSTVWEFDIGHPSYSTPVVYDGYLYFGSWEMLWCVPAEDPNGDGRIAADEVVWSFPTHDYQGGSSPLVTEEAVYIGSDNWNLYSVGRRNGSLIWNFSARGYIYSSPAIYRGRIYFGSSDRGVYCVGEGEGIEVELSISKGELGSFERAMVVVRVRGADGKPADGALVIIECSAGEFEGGGKRVKVRAGVNGTLSVEYTPPPVSSRSTITFHVSAIWENSTAEKEGRVVVTPSGISEDVSAPSPPGRKRYAFYLAFLLAIDAVLAFIAVRLGGVKLEG